MINLDWQSIAIAWLGTFAVHSTVLLAAAFLVSRFLPKRADALREWVWKTAMFGGLVTSIAQFSFVDVPVFGHLEILSQTASAGEGTSGYPASPGSTDGESNASPVVPVFPADPEAGNDTAVPAALGATAAPEVREPVAPASGSALSPIASFSTLELGEWLLLAAALSAAFGLGFDILARFRLSCRLQKRRPVSSGPMPGLLTELSILARYPRAIRFTSSARIKSPIAFGALWPEICIPERALVDLSREQAQAMLAHELAHICRNDPVWLRLAGVLSCLFPWQILLRAANRDLQACVELRCDAQAARWLGGGVSVAQCLVEVAGWLTGPRGPVVAGIPAMAVRGSALKLRVDRLLHGQATGTIGWQGLWLVPGLVSSLAAVAVVAPGAAWPVTATEVSVLALPTSGGSSSNLVAVDRAVLQDVVSELLRLLDRERAGLGAEVAELVAELSEVEMTAEMQNMLDLLHSKLAGLDARRDHFNKMVNELLSAAVTVDIPSITNPDSRGEIR